MTDNEKLIERLRAVIDTAASDSMLVENDRVVTRAEHDACQAERDEAEVVRDLIIAALTPTDDERGTLACALFVADETDKLTVEECEPLASKVYELGFRRSEVPELQGEPSDAQEAVRRLKAAGVGAYMILAAVTKVYDMEAKS